MEPYYYQFLKYLFPDDVAGCKVKDQLDVAHLLLQIKFEHM